MTQQSTPASPTPEPAQIDPVQDKATAVASAQTALQAMLDELAAVAKDSSQTFTSVADLKSAAALPDFQRDSSAIDDFIKRFTALSDAVVGQEEPAWRAAVAAKQPLVLPSFQDMVDKYYPNG